MVATFSPLNVEHSPTLALVLDGKGVHVKVKE